MSERAVNPTLGLAVAPLLLAWAGPTAVQGGAGTGSQAAAPAPPHIVLAVVDGHELTLQAALDTFLSSHTGHAVLVRGEAAVRDLAGRLVERELFLNEARTLGVPEEPEVLAVLRDFRRQTAANEYWKRQVHDP